MVSAISKDSRIEIRKSFLGTSVSYRATGSKIKVFKAECSAECGQQMERVLKSTDASLEKTVQTTAQFKETPMGHYMLEGLVSADHEYVALRLYRFVELSYSPVTELKVYEGAKAQIVSRLF